MSWDRPWEPEPESLSNLERWQQNLEWRRLDRLDDDVIKTGFEIDQLRKRLESEKRKVAELNELQARKRALLSELRHLEQTRATAVKETKEIERQLRIQQARTEREADQITGPRYGRPVRIDVDNGAWEAIRLVTIEQRTSLRLYVGEMVTAEAALLDATPDLGPPSSRWRRSPGEGAPRPRSRSLRIEVDDDAWTTIRAAARRTDTTISRYLGAVVESRAHGLGHRRVRRGSD